jgi:hypothetical protein
MKRSSECREKTVPGSTLLLELAARASRGPVCLSDIVEIAGRRAHAAVLAIVTLPEALPVPVMGVSAVLAIPLIFVSAHMVIFGAAKGIPPTVARCSIPQKLVTAIASRGAQVLRRVERISRPRLHRLADQDRLLALMCLVLAVVIAIPIPFGNLLPAICILSIAVGMVQRDGLLVAVGVVGGLLLLGLGGFVGNAVVTRLLEAWRAF